ncbi:hypothetical protein AB1K83_14750 [Sporosarcina sp. 179-K 3D1 HS]|uniref:hypothetical protein n=1 Tax=Sporosarcina sp. 179-K 3D1 HS TaxID=3232169 RepID=UPI00399F6CEA
MTTTRTMSIHRALSELKTLNDRIAKAIREADFIATDRKSAQKFNGLSIDEYEKTIQAGFDKAVSLIERRNRIKDAIVQSNAVTEVVVAGETMTVAKAIERKTSIQNEENLLASMVEARRTAINRLTKENESLPRRLEEYLTAILGNKEHAKKRKWSSIPNRSWSGTNMSLSIHCISTSGLRNWKRRCQTSKPKSMPFYPNPTPSPKSLCNPDGLHE